MSDFDTEESTIGTQSHNNNKKELDQSKTHILDTTNNNNFNKKLVFGTVLFVALLLGVVVLLLLLLLLDGSNTTSTTNSGSPSCPDDPPPSPPQTIKNTTTRITCRKYCGTNGYCQVITQPNNERLSYDCVCQDDYYLDESTSICKPKNEEDNIIDPKHLDTKWKPICDLRVVENIAASGGDHHDVIYELQDSIGTFCNNNNDILVIQQGTARNYTSWETMQPSTISKKVMGQDVPHLQTNQSYMMVPHGFEMDSESDWTISFVGAELHPSPSSFNIILGPRNNNSTCNCQLRYEEGNFLGLYATSSSDGSGYGGWYNSFSVTADSNSVAHVLTLTHHHNGTMRIYQNTVFFYEIESQNAHADLGMIGAWFNGRYSSHIAIQRIAYLKGYIEHAEMDDFVRRMNS